MSLRDTLKTNFPLGTTEHMAVSTEGFSDVVKSVKKLLGKFPKTFDVEDVTGGIKDNRKSIEEFRKIVKTFYGNPTWVAKQKLHTDPVNGAGIASAISLDGRVGNNPLDNVKEGQKRLKTFLEAYLRTCNKVKQNVQATHSKFKVDLKEAADKYDGKPHDVIEKAIADQRKNLEPLRNVPPLPKTFLGSIEPKLTIDKYGLPDIDTKDIPVSDGDTIPPLTASEIVEVAKMAVAILDGEFAGDKNFIDKAVKIVIDEEREPQFAELVDQEFGDAGRYYDMLGFSRLSSVFGIHFGVWNRKELLGALVLWIERSIK
tara:strand:+ start:2567 stop:3511 length:945 start_codon:yes stop_codon:yes gene_type:complete